MKAIYTEDGRHYLNPKKLFEVTKSAVDKVLSPAHHMVEHKGQKYRVTAHERAPVKLHIESITDKSRVFDVDLVPTVQLPASLLKSGPYASLWSGIEEKMTKLGLEDGKQVRF